MWNFSHFHTTPFPSLIAHPFPLKDSQKALLQLSGLHLVCGPLSFMRVSCMGMGEGLFNGARATCQCIHRWRQHHLSSHIHSLQWSFWEVWDIRDPSPSVMKCWVASLVRILHNVTECGKFLHSCSWSRMIAMGLELNRQVWYSDRPYLKESSKNNIFGEEIDLIWKTTMGHTTKGKETKMCVKQLTVESICCHAHPARQPLSSACSLLHQCQA